MAIPSVVKGWIHVEDGSLTDSTTVTGLVFINNPNGFEWLESVDSFRYVPYGEGLKPYTVRRESNYWYGYRKTAGRLHKKYIGKTSEKLWTGVLEEIAEALNIPPQPRVARKVVDTVDQKVTEAIGNCEADRLTALELQVQALQESLEALREELRGKSDLGNSEELPTVTDSELQNGLGNLQAENEALKEENENLRRSLERSDTLISLRNKEIAALNSRLAAKDETIAELDEQIGRLDSELETERADREKLEAELSDLKQNSEIDFDYAGKAGELVSWLRKIVGKALPKQVTLKEVQRILECRDN